MDKKQAQRELDQIKDRIKELEKIINEPEDKTKEMSDFLFAMFNETTMKITGDKEFTFYKDEEWIFQQDYKNDTLWVSYHVVWQVFEEKYGLNYQQIKDFIAAWVCCNTEWKG